MEKLNTWKIKSQQLDDDIDDLFKQNNEFSMEIIKERVNKYQRTFN